MWDWVAGCWALASTGAQLGCESKKEKMKRLLEGLVDQLCSGPPPSPLSFSRSLSLARALALSLALSRAHSLFLSPLCAGGVIVGKRVLFFLLHAHFFKFYIYGPWHCSDLVVPTWFVNTVTTPQKKETVGTNSTMYWDCRATVLSLSTMCIESTRNRIMFCTRSFLGVFFGAYSRMRMMMVAW